MGILDELAAYRPVTDPEILETYRRDEADFCAAGMPLAMLRPSTTGEVAEIVRIAGRYGVPIVPQGARTGLAGGANAVDGCLILSLTGMNQILEIDPVNRLAVVQPGVVNSAISAAVAEHGLWYPPDPGSWESSTIGGNVSTDAGGMCCVKYGVTSRYVLGLEVVLADGEILRTGRRTPKGVAGYDLTRLFTGAEGTLGIITEITLGLRPRPAAGLSIAAIFPTTQAAGAAVTAIVAGGHVPSLLELLDQVHLRAIEDYRPMGLRADAAALLLIADDAQPLEPLAELCAAAGATEVHVATDAVESAALLAARRLAHPAMEQLGKLIIDDVAVPVSRLAELLDGIERIAGRHGLVIGVVGHAGDGNMHPNIVVSDEAAAEAAFEEIMALGLELGGTCTGEHGVGLLKRDWLARELGPAGVRVHHAIKAALDPRGLLNPGKILAP
ncbi:FAD-binding oxidoreductase [Longispora albida]|uniref:FAD-binding oxidoreductase n=1 Tax=Longispora albida TaxID=203523 RepID=UPI00035D1499|nr:FAD-linked oxidase C-terminal domain-containing protein [Longispora albida]